MALVLESPGHNKVLIEVGTALKLPCTALSTALQIAD